MTKTTILKGKNVYLVQIKIVSNVLTLIPNAIVASLPIIYLLLTNVFYAKYSHALPVHLRINVWPVQLITIGLRRMANVKWDTANILGGFGH